MHPVVIITVSQIVSLRQRFQHLTIVYLKLTIKLRLIIQIANITIKLSSRRPLFIIKY